MPQSYRRDSLVIFFLLAFIFAFFYQDGGANGNSRMGLIFAIVQEGRLSIDDYYNKPGTGTIDVAFSGGHYYSDKAIGPAVLGVILYEPIYWVQQVFHRPSETTVKEILTILIVGLPAAVAGGLLYILCLFISGSRSRSYLTTLAVALGTMYLPYSVIFFSHTLTASLLFGSFFLIFFLKEKPGVRKNVYLILIGLLLGWAFICEYPSGLIILALILYYLSIIRKNTEYRNWRSILLPAIGGMIPLILQLVYNKACFGSILSIGYSNEQNQVFRESMNQGFMGISWPSLSALFYTTFHPTMGLFWQSPVLLLGFIGAGYGLVRRRFRSETILACCIIISYLVILSGYYMWWGGSSLGPRHTIPMIPFFGLLLIFIPKKLNWLFVGLTVVSIGQMIIAAASSVLTPESMILKIPTMGFFDYSIIYNFCLKRLIDGNFTQNLSHRILHLNAWASLIPLLIVIAGATFFFFRMEKKAILVTRAAGVK